MIRNTEDEKRKIFFIQCANWEGAVLAYDEKEAATLALEEANDIFGKNLCLAPSITVHDMNKISTHESLDHDLINLLFTPTVLADAGMHSLSKKYSKVIKAMSGETE
jgi:hypothetical protein